jgi:hypothetical protein
MVNDRLRDESDPVELTPAGEAAFVFLVQSRETLNRGTMVLEGEMRRALDLFMHYRASAYDLAGCHLQLPQIHIATRR